MAAVADQNKLLKRQYYEENSYVRYAIQPGTLYGFNGDHGYIEAICRGFRSGFLTGEEYYLLGQCESLEDFKLCFNDTDYMGALESVDHITVDIIDTKCYQKTVDEFNFLRNQAVGSLSTFLDFVQYEYMIKNVMYLITGLVNGNDGKQLLERIDPIGSFPRVASILTFENSEAGFLELYRTVLVDTPIGKYFERYFVENQPTDTNIKQIKDIMEEAEVEVIKEHIEKYWLTDFYYYVKKLGGITADLMLGLLEFRADVRAINIMLNSFGTNLSSAAQRDKRMELFVPFGSLYPSAIGKFHKCTSEEDLYKILNMHKDVSGGDKFGEMLAKADSLARDQGTDLTWADTISDVMLEEECFLNKMAFESQSHYACFYAFIQLKMQEKRNIFWIAECINQGRSEAEEKVISPFSLTRKNMAM